MGQDSCLELGPFRAHTCRMEMLTCKGCRSEYDVQQVSTEGWARECADELCGVCGAVLKQFDPDHQPVLVLTKHGNRSEAGVRHAVR